MGGHIFAGIGQLILAVTGFVMVSGWFVQLFMDFYHQLKGTGDEALPFPWLGPVGAATFVASWFWSLITSLSLLREARRNDRNKPN